MFDITNCIRVKRIDMKSTVLKVWRFYVDGFKSMTLGKVLWTIILVKLFIMFFILKPLFFPRYLNNHESEAPAQEIVADELINRGIEE